MAPDAWHCVDGNSQMAEWIFPFPSGCMTWWRCSQSLEPKEDASRGDEVLLLSRHLILAGWYCDLGFNLFFKKQVTLMRTMIVALWKYRGRQTQRDLKIMSHFLSFKDRSSTDFAGAVTLEEGPLLPDL